MYVIELEFYNRDDYENNRYPDYYRIIHFNSQDDADAYKKCMDATTKTYSDPHYVHLDVDNITHVSDTDIEKITHNSSLIDKIHNVSNEILTLQRRINSIEHQNTKLLRHPDRKAALYTIDDNMKEIVKIENELKKIEVEKKNIENQLKTLQFEE